MAVPAASPGVRGKGVARSAPRLDLDLNATPKEAKAMAAQDSNPAPLASRPKPAGDLKAEVNAPWGGGRGTAAKGGVQQSGSAPGARRGGGGKGRKSSVAGVVVKGLFLATFTAALFATFAVNATGTCQGAAEGVLRPLNEQLIARGFQAEQIADTFCSSRPVQAMAGATAATRTFLVSSLARYTGGKPPLGIGASSDAAEECPYSKFMASLPTWDQVPFLRAAAQQLPGIFTFLRESQKSAFEWALAKWGPARIKQAVAARVGEYLAFREGSQPGDATEHAAEALPEVADVAAPETVAVDEPLASVDGAKGDGVTSDDISTEDTAEALALTSEELAAVPAEAAEGPSVVAELVDAAEDAAGGELEVGGAAEGQEASEEAAEVVEEAAIGQEPARPKETDAGADASPGSVDATVVHQGNAEAGAGEALAEASEKPAGCPHETIMREAVESVLGFASMEIPRQAGLALVLGAVGAAVLLAFVPGLNHKSAAPEPAPVSEGPLDKVPAPIAAMPAREVFPASSNPATSEGSLEFYEEGPAVAEKFAKLRIDTGKQQEAPLIPAGDHLVSPDALAPLPEFGRYEAYLKPSASPTTSSSQLTPVRRSSRLLQKSIHSPMTTPRSTPKAKH